MKRFGILAAALVGMATIGATVISPAGDGKTIFKENKCMNCHAIASQGIDRVTSAPLPAGAKTPPDLSGVGLKHKADWIQKWLMKEEEQEGKKHLKKFQGPEADLTTLSNWLSTLKKK